MLEKSRKGGVCIGFARCHAGNRVGLGLHHHLLQDLDLVGVLEKSRKGGVCIGFAGFHAGNRVGLGLHHHLLQDNGLVGVL